MLGIHGYTSLAQCRIMIVWYLCGANSHDIRTFNVGKIHGALKCHLSREERSKVVWENAKHEGRNSDEGEKGEDDYTWQA